MTHYKGHSEELYCPLCEELEVFEECISPWQEVVKDLSNRLKGTPYLTSNVVPKKGGKRVLGRGNLAIEVELILASPLKQIGFTDDQQNALSKLKEVLPHLQVLLRIFDKLSKEHPVCKSCGILVGPGHITRVVDEDMGLCGGCMTNKATREKAKRKKEVCSVNR